MFSTAKSRREAAERKADEVAVIGPGYTLDISREAADAGLSYGVLEPRGTGGFLYVNEPYGYYDVQGLPRKPD